MKHHPKGKLTDIVESCILIKKYKVYRLYAIVYTIGNLDRYDHDIGCNIL